MRKLIIILLFPFFAHSQAGGLLVNGWSKSVAPFVPTDIAGLKLWLKADTINITDNTEVTTWLDGSGTANDATGATGVVVKPKYRTSQINGHAAVQFTTTDQGYFTLTNSISSALSYTVFVVYKKSSALDLFPTLTSSATSPYTWYDFLDGNSYTNGRGNTYFTGVGGYTSFSIISEIAESGSETAWVNGTTLTFSAGSGTGGSNNFIELGRRNATVEYANGFLAEILFYDTALSTVNRQKVETYLNVKYAIF